MLEWATAWAYLSGGASPAHPCLPPQTCATQVPVCFVTQPSSWCWGDAALLGGAVKLFIGEVGAGNEAKSQPWPRRRRKAMTSLQGTGH